MKHTLEELLRPGNKVRMFFGEGNPNNCLMHIRAVVDEVVIVYRYWRKRKGYWQYVSETLYYFELLYKDGRLTFVGKERGVKIEIGKEIKKEIKEAAWEKARKIQRVPMDPVRRDCRLNIYLSNFAIEILEKYGEKGGELVV